ncbi:MAG TPA: hypothetical protein VIZ65_07330 [Cellvibrionaceae bacterium]
MPVTYKGGAKFTKNVSQVPNSCIESAEFILQVINSGTNDSVTWDRAEVSRTPHVYAEFKSHYINITDTADFHDYITESIVSYPFGSSLPTLGEGICLVNKGQDSGGYNMHFGAVVAVQNGSVEISDMNEPNNAPVGLAPLETITIKNVNDFRANGYEHRSTFALGKLTVNPNTNKQKLG